MGHHYTCFSGAMFVSMKCAKGYHSFKVSGHFSIPQLYSSSSSKVTTHSEILYQCSMSKIFKRISIGNKNISIVKYVTNSISQLTFANFSKLQLTAHDSFTFLRTVSHASPFLHHNNYHNLFLSPCTVSLLWFPFYINSLRTGLFTGNTPPHQYMDRYLSLD